MRETACSAQRHRSHCGQHRDNLTSHTCISSLTRRYGTAGQYRLNFQRSMLELIHETKWLARMGFDIPEAAQLLQPQEIKFIKYCDILTELLSASSFKLHSACVCGPCTTDLSDESSTSELNTLIYMGIPQGQQYFERVLFLWLLGCDSHPLGADRLGLSTCRHVLCIAHLCCNNFIFSLSTHTCRNMREYWQLCLRWPNLYCIVMCLRWKCCYSQVPA